MVAFNPPRDRDAWASIRGFVYQVDLTIRRWLDLAPEKVLELERGEDIDLVSSSILAEGEESSRLLEQVKHREQPVTLLSEPAVFAIACAIEHREANPQLTLRFRFTTNARVGKERFSQHPQPGIEAWEDIRSGATGADNLPAAVAAIRSILKAARKPSSLNPEAWAAYSAAMEHGSDAELLDFIRVFEWGTRTEDATNLRPALTQLLVSSGRARDLIQARALYERLFLHVFKTISRDGIKRLTTPDLNALLALPTLSESDRSLLESVVFRLLDVENRLDQGDRERCQQDALIERLDGQVQALAREQRVLASIEYAAEDLDLELPPPCPNLARRESDVALIRELLMGHTWTAIHGGTCTGKTQLAALVARSLDHPPTWVRLRDLGSRQAARRIDVVFQALSGVPARSGPRRRYLDGFSRLDRGSIIVLEDLPRIDMGDPLSERLVQMVAAAKEAEVHLFTTSCFPLSPRVVSSAPEGAVRAVSMPPFGVEDARALLRALGAPEPLLEKRFVTHINDLARHHPLLLDAIGRYLAQRQWRFRDEEWDDILAGRHTAEVTRETISRLLHTVEDHRSRELLYRLTLVIGTFSEEDAFALASVAPILERPRERLHAVVGPWVQTGGRGQLLLSPLIDAVGSVDLPRAVCRRCLLRLGSRVIRRGRIGPEELSSAVTYFARGRAFDRSGLLLIQALAHLNSMEKLVDPRDVLSLWYGIPLPERMNLGLRLYLRALQYRVRTRYRRSVEGLLADVDRLSCEATESEGWAVLGAAVLLGRHLGDVDRLLGIRLLRRAFQLKTEFRTYADRELAWPDGLGPEWMIWSVAGDLANEEELAEWRATVEVLGPGHRLRAFAHETAEPGCTIVAGALYRAELKKSPAERRWDRVLERIDELARWARELGLELLWASAVRHRLIILGEDLRRTGEAVTAATEALRQASNDPRVRFLLSDSIGEFLIRDGKPEEALEWLEQALASETNVYTLERLLLLVNASRATVLSAPERSLAFLREAGRLAREDEDLPDMEFARVLGEIAIGEGLAGHLPECFRALEEGVERLLRCKEDSNRWRILFVLIGHASGYFTSLAFRGSPPDSTRAGDEYAAPRRGILFSYTQDLAEYYDSTREYGIALQMAIFADAVGDDVKAASWAAKALELTRDAGQHANVEEITHRFVPQLMLDDRYADAMEAAIGYGAVLVARTIERQAGRNELPSDLDVASILGERPNENWRQAERWAALLGLLPAVVRLGELAIERPDSAKETAREIVSICRQIGGGAADPAFWASLAGIVEHALLEPIGVRAYRAMTEEIDTTVYGIPKMIAMLLLSIQPGVTAEEALMLHLSIMPGLEQCLDRPFSAYRRILVPFFTSYWTATFRRMRFRFRYPDLVEEAIIEAATSPTEQRIGAVARAVLIGIPLRLPPETGKWLDQK